MHASIEQTRVTDAVRHVKTTTVGTDDNGDETTTTAKYVDYIHKDHLGSVEGATDEAGARTRTLQYDPFGERRKADWTAALTDAERAALAGSSDPRTRGHAGHEHLDRTGLIHRGGRVYDPALGRFLSPDPLVGNRGSAQSWNGYSYVSNSPMSFVDPSGLSQAPGGGGCNLVGVMCGAAGGGFGLASVVSTHRFSFVDIFVSVSLWITQAWNSGSGVIYNYSGESDPYFGGWGWGSFDAFAGVSYGYSYWSGSVQVPSQVAVAGETPNVAGKDIKGPNAGPDRDNETPEQKKDRSVIGIFWDNNRDMKEANTRGSDKYFHCKVNCDATQLGSHGERDAKAASDIREWWQVKRGTNTVDDSAADQRANEHGREQARKFPEGSCRDLCQKYRPNGLDEKY